MRTRVKRVLRALNRIEPENMIARASSNFHERMFVLRNFVREEGLYVAHRILDRLGGR